MFLNIVRGVGHGFLVVRGVGHGCFRASRLFCRGSGTFGVGCKFCVDSGNKFFLGVDCGSICGVCAFCFGDGVDCENPGGNGGSEERGVPRPSVPEVVSIVDWKVKVNVLLKKYFVEK